MPPKAPKDDKVSSTLLSSSDRIRGADVIDFWSEEQEQEFESTAADSSDQAATSGWRKEQGGGKCCN
jgi:hypothetical protein